MTNHINLMSPRSRVRECSRTRLRQWSRILGATAAVLVLHGALSWWPVHMLGLQRVALESQYEPLRLMKLENKTLERKIAETLDESQLELALSRQTPVATLVGLIGRAVAETEGDVFLDKITYLQTESTEAGPGSDSVVHLEGVSADPAAAGQFGDRLKSNVKFAKVRVGTVEAIEINHHSMQTFKIEFSF